MTCIKALAHEINTMPSAAAECDQTPDWKRLAKWHTLPMTNDPAAVDWATLACLDDMFRIVGRRGGSHSGVILSANIL